MIHPTSKNKLKTFIFQLKNTSPIKSQKSSTISNIRWTTTHRLLSQGQEKNYEGTEETHRRREQGQKLDKVSKQNTMGSNSTWSCNPILFNNVFYEIWVIINQSQKQIRTGLKYFMCRKCDFVKLLTPLCTGTIRTTACSTLTNFLRPNIFQKLYMYAYVI